MKALLTIVVFVGLSLVATSQGLPSARLIPHSEYNSSWGVLHGTATDTSATVSTVYGTYAGLGIAFTSDSIVARIVLQYKVAETWDDTLQVLSMTYADSTTTFGAIAAKITAAGVKYAWTKGNADSLVYKTFNPSTANPGHVTRTTSGDITTTDSTSAGAFLVYGDTTGTKLRAHSATPAASLVQSYDISTNAPEAWTALRVWVYCLARTGKEGTYKIYLKEW